MLHLLNVSAIQGCQASVYNPQEVLEKQHEGGKLKETSLLVKTLEQHFQVNIIFLPRVARSPQLLAGWETPRRLEITEPGEYP